MTPVAVRRVARLQRGAGFPHEYQGTPAGDLPFYKVSDFNLPGNERYLRTCTNWITKDVAKRLRAIPVPPGSVLLPKIGAALLGNARRITTCWSVFDNNVLAVVPVTIEASYLHYWLSTIDLRRLAHPGPIPSLDDTSLSGLSVPRSAIQEQRAIADFLDTETARIDALITKKRRMIDLLGERKAATMLASVGGRLTHSGPFELSSLAWLKKRPAHWREVLIRLVAQTGSGHTPSRERPEWWENCTIPWITTGEVAQIRSDQREEILDTREKISEVGLANSAAVLHPRGTVVLCRTASAGYSGIMGVDMASSQDFATWTCGSQVRPRYLLLCLRAMRPDLLGRLATGSTHKTIYMPDIHALKIPLPSLLEQELAVEAAWRCLDPLFTAMDRLRQQIALLQEHRQALITAAVTGELRVPGVAA